MHTRELSDRVSGEQKQPLWFGLLQWCEAGSNSQIRHKHTPFTFRNGETHHTGDSR